MTCRYCGRSGRPSLFIQMHDGTHRCDDALQCQHRIRKRQKLTKVHMTRSGRPLIGKE
jgi:hypothetical protein